MASIKSENSSNVKRKKLDPGSIKRKILKKVVRTVKNKIKYELRRALGPSVSKLPKDFWSRLRISTTKDSVKLAYTAKEIQNETKEARRAQIRALLAGEGSIVNTPDGMAFKWSEQAQKELSAFVVDMDAATKALKKAMKKVDKRLEKILDKLIQEAIEDLILDSV